MGIAPVFWASFSDYYRIRRFFLILSMVIFAFSSLGCALVNNIGGLVVLRCIQSVSSSAAQSVGAGVVADCYPVENEVQRLTNSFWVSLSARLSVSFDLLLLLRLLFTFTNMIYILGPIIGGFLIMSELTWKATFWFCFAFGMAVFLYLFFLYPETYRDNAKFDAADVGDAETIKNVPTTTATHPKINPIEPFFLLRHPFIAVASFILGIAFGCMFAVETIIPDLMEQHYGFNAWQTGKPPKKLLFSSCIQRLILSQVSAISVQVLAICSQQF